jgi:uracil-DNA glycosylase
MYKPIRELLDKFEINVNCEKLDTFLEHESFLYEVFPKYENIFRALELCPLDQAKVVILGQDPYHGKKQANGLAFSVQKDQKMPPSLMNIRKEIYEDTGTLLPNGDFSHLAKNGVLLLNCVLTVRESSPNSHKNHGWEEITDYIIKRIQKNPKVVFLLWGKIAQLKRNLIDETKHHVLTAPHPSPLSAYKGFFGCRHFSQTNAIFQENIF